jgi:hypothetical protein
VPSDKLELIVDNIQVRVIKLHLISFLFLISCKKYGDGSISGTVYETGRNSPVPNTEVSILRVYQKYDLHGSVQHQNTEIISRTLSDNNGKYKINFHKKVGSKYYIKCLSDSLYARDIHEYANFKNYKHDIYIKPYWYFKVRVVKNSINTLKRIDITLPLNQFASVKALNKIDTTLPKIFKAIGFTENIIDHYTCTLPPYTTYSWEECSWFTEKLYLTSPDTIVKTFIID